MKLGFKYLSVFKSVFNQWWKGGMYIHFELNPENMYLVNIYHSTTKVIYIGK